MEYRCGWGATLTFGRFNAPLGFELVDPNEMFQFSHSLVYTYGLPVNLTGAMVRKAWDGGLDARAYAVNGWDRNDETNQVPTWGGRVGFLAMAHHEVNSWFGLTVRYDRYDDEDGYAFGLIGDQPQVRQAAALAPTFVLDDGGIRDDVRTVDPAAQSSRIR
jgi:hypothetical protein